MPNPSRRAIAVLSLLTLLVLAGCAGRADAPARSTNPVTTDPDDPAARAARLAGALSDEDLVGQVLMPYAYGNSATDVTPASAAGNRKLAGVETPAQMIAKYRLGGLILVGFSADDPTGKNQPTSNVDSPQQVRRLTTALQRAAAELPAGRNAPLLIGTDQEYGIVTRIRSGVTALPSAMAFGAAGDPALTERAWRAAGTELAALGVNLDFAPVADVLGARSDVIGSRSYGSDPKATAGQVAAAVRGLEGAGVASTLKHFPGHGHTVTDSHKALPVLAQNRRSLDARDLPPFTAGIDAGASLVMSGHLDVRAVDPGTPATFSRKLLTDVLRHQMGFTGVVVTDGMNMAPAMRYPAGEAAVRAINAGNDLLLMPPDVKGAYEGLLGGLRSGELPRDRMLDAVTRVLTLKLRLAAERAPEMSTLNSAAHRQAVQRLAAAAVTQLRGSCARTAVRGPITVTSSGGRDGTRQLLTAALRAAGARVVATGGTKVHLVGYGDTATDLSKDAAVTVAMDTPTILAGAKSPVLLATYSSSGTSMSALAAVLTGRATAPGRSPIAVPGLPPTVCAG